MKAVPVRLQTDDFSQDEEIASLKATSTRMGGIATFLGCARDFSESRMVSEISFDAYDRMAELEMAALREAAIEKFGLIDARIVHRVGTVGAGDNIVFIAAGAEHRAEAGQRQPEPRVAAHAHRSRRQSHPDRPPARRQRRHGHGRR